jgi:Dimerisation domain/O-methyltransferase domain
VLTSSLEKGNGMINTTEWSKLCAVMNGYVYSEILVTCCRLGIFDFLELHPYSNIEDISSIMNLSIHPARVMMLGICATGLVMRDSEGKYYNSDLARKSLLKTSPNSMVSFVLFNDQVQRECMRYLAESITKGTNCGLAAFPGKGQTLYQRLSQYPEVEKLFQEGMGQYTRTFPQMLKWEQFYKTNHLLDIGGGDGSNAIRIAEVIPHIEITILEKPEICKIAEQKISQSMHKNRINVVPCDVFEFDWKTSRPVDGVLFSHFVEIFSLDTIRSLYDQAFKVLPDDGLLYVWTMMCNETESGGL